ncbi:MAG: hypothetical protein RSB66_06140 [Clostridium sp.]
MSRYTLRVNDNINCKDEILEATGILSKGDYLAIYTANDITKQSILGILDNNQIGYNHVYSDGSEYILAKK